MATVILMAAKEEVRTSIIQHRQARVVRRSWTDGSAEQEEDFLPEVSKKSQWWVFLNYGRSSICV